MRAIAFLLMVWAAVLPLAAQTQDRVEPDPAGMDAWASGKVEEAAESFDGSITQCEAASRPDIACMDLYLMRLFAARELDQADRRAQLLARIEALIAQGAATAIEQMRHAQEEARYLHSARDFAGAAVAADRWIALALDIGVEARWDVYWALDSAAWIQRELGQPDQAIPFRKSQVQLAESLAQEDPAAPVRAQFQLGRFHYWEGRYDAADRAFAAAQASAEGLAPEPLTYELGWIAAYRSITQLIAEEKAASDDQFATMLGRFTADPTTLDPLELFSFYREQATISLAINPAMGTRLFTMIDTLFPDDIAARAQYRLIRAHQIVPGSRWDTVAEYYGAAIALYRDNGRPAEQRSALQGLANWMVRADRHEEAIAALDAMPPGDAVAQFRQFRTRGDALAGLGKYDEAEAAYRAASAIEKRLIETGRCARQYGAGAGKCVADHNYVNLWEPFQPYVVDLRLSLAGAVERQNRLADAAALRSAFEADPPVGVTEPEIAQNRLALAINFDAQDRYDDAAAIFERGIAAEDALEYRTSQDLVKRYGEIASRFVASRTFAERAAVQARYQALYDAVNGRTLSLSRTKDGKRATPDFAADARDAATKGNFGQAETLMRRHLQQWELSRGMTVKDDPGADLSALDVPMFNARRLIGDYLLAQGRNDDAELWLRSLLSDLAADGSGEQTVADIELLSARLLARALEAQERRDDAGIIRRELVADAMAAKAGGTGGLQRLLGEQLRLADNLTGQGRYRDAEEIARDILLRLPADFDALGSEAADVYVRVSQLLNPGRSTAENEALLRRGIELHRASGDSADLAVLQARRRLMILLEGSNRAAEAADLRAELLAAVEPMIATGNISAISIYAGLARSERGPDAEKMLRRVLQLRRATLAADDLGIAGALTDLAAHLRGEGRLDESIALSLDARRIYLAAVEPGDLRRIIGSVNLAVALQRQQRYAAARTVTREMIAGALARQDQARDFDAEAQSELNVFGPSFRQLIQLDWELAQQSAD